VFVKTGSKLSKTELFETAAPARAIMALALPTIVNQLITVVYNLSDMFFIGRLNNESMVAAVSLSASAMVLLNAAGNLFSVGCSSLTARSLGAKQYKRLPEIATLASIMAVLIGILYLVISTVFMEPFARYLGASDTSLGYTEEYLQWAFSINAVPMIWSLCLGACLRGRGDSRHEMIGLTSGNLLNILLDPLFIYVFDMGVKGAAVATCISTCVSLGYFLVYTMYVKRDEQVFLPLKGYRFDFELMREICKIGLPASYNSLLVSVNTTLYHNVIKAYSDAAVAAAGITRKVEHAMGQVIVGLTQGTIPIIAYNYASKDFDRMKKVRRTALIIGALWGVVALVMFITVPGTFIRAFTPGNDAVIGYGSKMLMVVAGMPLLMCYNNQTRHVLQALGHPKKSILLTTCRQLIFYGPLILLLSAKFGVLGAVLAMPVSELAADVIAYFLYKRMLRTLREENT